MSEQALLENPRAVIGDNNPPEPTPFEIAAQKVNDIYDETLHWLDGRAIDSQEIADGVGNLLALIRKAEKLADDTRKAEKAELDKKVAEIQSRYAPLIGNTKAIKGKTVLAEEACKAALAPWLAKVEAEHAEKARVAQAAAEEARQKAQEALRASEPTDLQARAEAEVLVAAAKSLDTVANKAARQTATAGGTFGKSASLRTTWIAELTEPLTFGRYAWTNHRDEYEGFLKDLADRLVRNGARMIPGVSIIEEKKAV